MSYGQTGCCRGKLTAIAAGLVVIAMVQGIVPLTTQGAVPCYPALSMRLDKVVPMCNLSPASDGLFVALGTVRTDKLPVERLVVRFSVGIDQPWPVSPQPEVMVITDTRDHPFNISINIPWDTPAVAVGNLSVSAVGTGGDYHLTASGMILIPVNPYHRIILDSPRPFASVPDGKTARCPVRVSNLGNTIESVDIEPAKPEGPGGLCSTIAMVEKERLSRIPPGRSVTVNISFDAAADVFSEGRLHAIRITARSLNASGTDANSTAEVLVCVYVRPGIWIRLGPPAMILSYCAVVAGMALVARKIHGKSRRNRLDDGPRGQKN